MGIDEVRRLLLLLTSDERSRLESISVAEEGTSIRFHPLGLSMLPNGQMVAALPEAEPQSPVCEGSEDLTDVDGMLPERLPLQDLTMTRFVDLLTLVALARDEGFSFSYGDAATWLDCDAAELQEFLQSARHLQGFGIWRDTLTPDESRRMKVAFQNLILVAPKGSIRETVQRLSAPGARLTDDLRSHIVSRYQLGQHVAISLRAVADVQKD